MDDHTPLSSSTRSTRLLPARALYAFVTTSVLIGCSDLPSKNDALDIVRHGVKEEASCTLPIPSLSRFKMQHTTKAICVPREGSPSPDPAMTCLDALVAAGVTKKKTG